MISIIISASNDPAALAALLTALTPAAVEGLVREVAVLGAIGAAAEMADDAGAVLYPADGFASAVAGARSAWLARLPIGARLAPDWMGVVAAHVALPPEPARLVGPPRLGLGRRAEGWLVPKPLAPSAGAVEQDFERLARRRGRRLRILRPA